MAVEVELAFARLVPVPGNVEVDRVDAEFAVPVERARPQIPRNALVEESRGMDEKRLSIDSEFRVAAVLDDFDATGVRGGWIGQRPAVQERRCRKGKEREKGRQFTPQLCLSPGHAPGF